MCTNIFAQQAYRVVYDVNILCGQPTYPVLVCRLTVSTCKSSFDFRCKHFTGDFLENTNENSSSIYSDPEYKAELSTNLGCGIWTIEVIRIIYQMTVQAKSNISWKYMLTFLKVETMKRWNLKSLPLSTVQLKHPPAFTSLWGASLLETG